MTASTIIPGREARRRLDESIFSFSTLCSADCNPIIVSFDLRTNIGFGLSLSLREAIGLPGNAAFGICGATMEQAENGRNKQERGYGRSHQSSDDRATERCVLLATISQPQGHRTHANDH